jgi:LPXTG-site transpeptidase (sortase) family protein
MFTRKKRHPWFWLILIGLFVGVWASRSAFLPAETAIATTTPDIPSTVAAAVAVEAPVSTVVPTAEVPESVALLSIPRLKTSARIVEKYLSGDGWDISLLGRNVGHLEGTTKLQGTGNSVLVGHVELSDGEFGPFHDIGTLTAGDTMILLLGTASQTYTVSEVYTTTPDDMTPLRPTTTERITLITCGDYDFIGNVYRERVIVVAERTL